MDQEKIGRFIQTCRKEVGLTQAVLAERLGITDRAVSKWETGKSLPDSSLMLPLCQELHITVNELLTGERLDTMVTYQKMAEENLLQLHALEEEANKKRLSLEWVIGFFGIVVLFGAIAVACFVEMPWWGRTIIGAGGGISFMIAMCYGLWIEQDAGYYECPECGERYKPTYFDVFFAPHMGRTRKLKCPKCGHKAWNKKVLTRYPDEPQSRVNDGKKR